jgi:hypothetical protein
VAWVSTSGDRARGEVLRLRFRMEQWTAGTEATGVSWLSPRRSHPRGAGGAGRNGTGGVDRRTPVTALDTETTSSPGSYPKEACVRATIAGRNVVSV